MVEKILLELGKLALSYLLKKWLNKHGMDRPMLDKRSRAFMNELGNHVGREIIAHEEKKGGV